jgi:hypothetical protein
VRPRHYWRPQSPLHIPYWWPRSLPRSTRLMIGLPSEGLVTRGHPFVRLSHKGIVPLAPTVTHGGDATSLSSGQITFGRWGRSMHSDQTVRLPHGGQGSVLFSPSPSISSSTTDQPFEEAWDSRRRSKSHRRGGCASRVRVRPIGAA